MKKKLTFDDLVDLNELGQVGAGGLCLGLLLTQQPLRGAEAAQKVAARTSISEGFAGVPCGGINDAQEESQVGEQHKREEDPLLGLRNGEVLSR